MNKLRSGLKYFMTGIIDYAGMYPPAKLAFEQAFTNFLAYQQVDDHWMMNRFVFPIQQAHQLITFAEQLSLSKKPIKLSVLPVYKDRANEFIQQFHSDYQILSDVIKKNELNLDITLFEFKLPEELKNASQSLVYPFFNSFLSVFDSKTLKKTSVYVEMCKLDRDWQYSMDRFTNLLAFYPTRNTFGFKLRCGGITSESFPEVSMVAGAIFMCREKGLSMKFTAGLHHPLSHFNSSLNTRMYGFFNVLGAAVLSHTHLLSTKELEELIIEERIDQFSFADQGMKWRDYVVNTEQIKQARDQFCIGYGSCSFDEPRQDLRSLQLL